ncbi:MAG: ATP-dependent protease ATPase subunit HslU, partial [Firmicutes bacterium]|nr:ATP-dependent protease ATPase subunit HslU [Bacillota bacterium]
KELNQYIIGQDDAKKKVAIAIRNRYRRSQLPIDLMEEITPKNIILIGATGIGKTEIARRLAKLVNAPFIKVEATKYTEVGYVGRDVESMIRDLVEESRRLVKKEKTEEVRKKAEVRVDKILKEAILNTKKREIFDVDVLNKFKETLEKEYSLGAFENFNVEIEILSQPKAMDNPMAAMGIEINIGEMFGGLMGGAKKKPRIFTVKEAREALMLEESDKLIDQDALNQEALRRAEQEGIVFVDEFDKIAIKGKGNNSEVSREGVQRDILPIVEGSVVSTKYGSIKTDYILFIAAGAFHMSRVEDLIPELQGRFPIRVELQSLKKEHLKRILTEPKHNMIDQYKNLLKVDNAMIEFTEDAIDEIAEVAEMENASKENIGARRLHTLVEMLLEEVSYNADGGTKLTNVKIDRKYVQNVFKKTRGEYDLKKYIL